MATRVDARGASLGRYSRLLSAAAVACAALGLAWQLQPERAFGVPGWRAGLAPLVGAYAAPFWVRLATGNGDLRRVSPVGALCTSLLAGGAALGLAFSEPPHLLLNLFWWATTLTAVVGVAWALGDRRHAVLAAETMLVLVLAHALGNPQARLAFDQERGDGISWTFSFERPDQRILKRFPRPSDWDSPVHDTYVRVDLAHPYQGRAGYEVWANGERLGEMHAHTPETKWGGPGGARWVLRVPRRVMALATLVTVELRPDGIDPRLKLAGHGDPRVEALGADSTWLFDGSGWTRDRLAGVGAGAVPEARGTYRIWLIHLLHPPEQAPLNGDAPDDVSDAS